MFQSQSTAVTVAEFGADAPTAVGPQTA